ncbi:MAG: hypothetical protein C4344_04230, partial [Acidimicrobiia bacterium]
MERRRSTPAVKCRPERISAYVDDELPPAERAQVEEHLARCAACRAREEAYRAQRALIGQLPRPYPPPSLQHSLYTRLAAERRRLVAHTAPGRVARW